MDLSLFHLEGSVAQLAPGRKGSAQETPRGSFTCRFCSVAEVCKWVRNKGFLPSWVGVSSAVEWKSWTMLEFRRVRQCLPGGLSHPPSHLQPGALLNLTVLGASKNGSLEQASCHSSSVTWVTKEPLNRGNCLQRPKRPISSRPACVENLQQVPVACLRWQSWQMDADTAHLGAQGRRRA